MNDQCRIDIQPRESLADQPITTLKVSNLPSHSTFTLRAKTKDEAGVVWISWGIFKSDASGFIDVSKQVPLSGTFTIADPSAILWAMYPEGKMTDPIPKFEKSTVEPLSIDISVRADEQILAETTINRLFHQVAVIVRELVNEKGVKGTLFYPKGKESYPVVICLSGSGGGYDETRASLLASHGFAVFAVAYFGVGSLPHELSEIPVEFFESALSWLKKHNEVDCGKIAVYGYSKGGELALLLGSLYPDIKAVAAFSGSSFVWQGLSFGRPASSWTQDNKPLPYLPIKVPFFTILKLLLGKKVAFRESYERGMQISSKRDEAVIRVEKINGPLFLVAGTEDQVWPATEFADIILSRLKHTEYPYAYTYSKEEGAGHLVGLPYFPSAEVYKNLIFTSGNNQLSSISMIKAWNEMIKFLDSSLK